MDINISGNMETQQSLGIGFDAHGDVRRGFVLCREVRNGGVWLDTVLCGKDK